MHQLGVVVSILSLCFSFCVSSAQADEAAISATVSAAAAPTPKPKALSLVLQIESVSDLRETDDVDANKGLEVSIIPSYKISPITTLSTVAGISRSLVGESREDTIVSNMRVSLSQKTAKILSVVQPAVIGSVVLPTNKESRETDTLRVGMGLDLSLGIPIGIANLEYRLGGDRFVHDYSLDRDGVPNVQTVARQRITASLVLGKIGVSAAGIFQSGWTYRGFVREKFSHSEDISYDVGETTAVSIGHTNEGAAFKANGRDSNVSFFNQNSSYFRTGLSHTF